MTEVKWHRIMATAALIVSVLLIGGSIYFHVRQKHHLGRLSYEKRTVTFDDVDASYIVTPVTTLTDDAYIDTIGSSSENRESSEYNPNFETSTQNTYNYRKNFEYKSSEASTRKIYDYKEISDYLEYPEYNDYSESNEHSELKHNPEFNEYNEYSDYNANFERSIQNTNNTQLTDSKPNYITEACMKCICETTNKCTTTTCGEGKSCGLLSITKAYWHDAGEPTIESDKNHRNSLTEYLKCIVDHDCAARAVNAYMKRYARDCNNDGVVDCTDFILIHMLGPTGCLMMQLPPNLESRMLICLTELNQ